MRALKPTLVLLLAICLQACNAPPDWHATDITGMMPDLEFELTGPDGTEVTARLLISDVNDIDAVVSDIKQLIDL